MSTFRGISALLASLWVSTALAGPPPELERAVKEGRWDDAVQIAFDAATKNQGDREVRLEGAIALFQKGHVYAALNFLKTIPPEDWLKFPEGSDRLVELLTLFHDKVPPSLLPWAMQAAALEAVSPYLKDEVEFALGHFDNVSKNSRVYHQARYDVAAELVKKGDLTRAESELQPLTEARESSGELASHVAHHWGAKLAEKLDEDTHSRTRALNDLATLGLARLKYASHDFSKAADLYGRIAESSRFYPRAQLERAWALVAMGRFEDARAAAKIVANGNYHFESVKGKLLHALALAFTGETAAARDVLDSLRKPLDDYHDALESFDKAPDIEFLPDSLREDAKGDGGVLSLSRFDQSLNAELSALNHENADRYPAYGRLAVELLSLHDEAKKESTRRTSQYFKGWLQQVEHLMLQVKLIRAETYLAEYEKKKEPALIMRAYEEGQEALKIGKAAQPNLEFRQAELLWEMGKRDEALKRAKDTLDRFSDFPRIAQARFFAGFALIELGRTEEGVAMLELFAGVHPKHENAPDARRILGDIRYDSDDYATARDHYRKILEFPASPLIGYTLYKIGWCSYRLGDQEDALKSLKESLLWYKEHDPTNEVLVPGGNAGRDLIAIYAEVGDHKKAAEYFTVIFGNNASFYVTELANVYEAKDQLDKAADLYRDLIRLHPGAPENLARQAALVRIAHKLHRWLEALEETKRLVYRNEAAFKSRPSSKNPVTQAEAIVRETLVAQHAELMPGSTDDELGRVYELDKLYLHAFHDWPEAEEPLYLHAKLAMRLKNLPDAVDAYKTHWDTFGSSLEDSLREEALRGLIHAEELLDAPKPGGEGLADRTVLDLLKYSAQYTSLYPRTRYTRPIAFLRSAILFKYERIEEGMKDAQAIFDANMGDEFARRCFKNLRVAHYRLKRWKDTYLWATEMASRPNIGAYVTELEQIRQETAFLYAESLPNDTAVAEEYLKIARDPSLKPVHEAAFDNSVRRFDKAGEKARALAVADEMEAAFPESRALAQLAGLRAAIEQDTGDYLKAYPLLKSFLARHDSDTPQEALDQASLNAALIAEALGETDQAKKLFTDLINEKPVIPGEPGNDTPSPLVVTAKSALARLNRESEREPASPPKAWEKLLSLKETLDESPLPKAKSAIAGIKAGAKRLESTAKQFLAYAQDKDAPPSFALESYCAVPLLYQSYTKAITTLAGGADDTDKGELMMFVTPLEAQAKKLANECMNRSAESEHDGEFYRQVIKGWGWEHDPGVRFLVTDVIKQMEKRAPWWDPKPVKLSEDEILKLHLNKGATPGSWYSLGKARFDDGHPGLARLTFLDAATRYQQGAGGALNGLACIDQTFADRKGILKLFEKAAANGSKAANANLALLHLKAGRLPAAIAPLEAASKAGILGDDPTLKAPVDELLINFRPDDDSE